MIGGVQLPSAATKGQESRRRTKMLALIKRGALFYAKNDTIPKNTGFEKADATVDCSG